MAVVPAHAADTHWAHCAHSCSSHAKCALPLKAVYSKFKRCIRPYHGNNTPNNIGPGIVTHTATSGRLYYRQGLYLTTNGLRSPLALSAFRMAIFIIERCWTERGTDPNRYEVAIVLRCVSPSRFKFRYYIVDHTSQEVTWLHGGLPGMVQGVRWLGYWQHMAEFPTHRFCTPDDYRNALELVDRMRVRALDPERTMPEDPRFEVFSSSLRRFNPEALDEYATVSIAKIVCNTFEGQATGRRPGSGSLGSPRATGLLKGFLGVISAAAGLAHERDHGSEEPVIKSPHSSHHNTPNPSPQTPAINIMAPAEPVQTDN